MVRVERPAEAPDGWDTRMRFVFDERKSAQAAVHLIGLNGGQINYMALIKLLYLSDRRALLETGYPITGDLMVSMPHGPVLSRIYDRINMGEPQADRTAWYELITEPDHYEVASRGEPVTDELSRYDLSVLDDIYERYGKMNKWALRDLTHTLPEWVDPNGSSLPIQPEDILRAEGRPSEEIEKIVSDAEGVWYLNQLDRLVS